jgi:hypothetical protein
MKAAASAVHASVSQVNVKDGSPAAPRSQRGRHARDYCAHGCTSPGRRSNASPQLETPHAAVTGKVRLPFTNKPFPTDPQASYIARNLITREHS